MRLMTVFVGLLSVVACGDKTGDTAAPADDTSTAQFTDAVCTDQTPIACTDQIILDLSLHDDKISDGDVTTTVDGDDFVTVIDASAGGYNQATRNPWTYVKFTSDGASRVEIDDETALESMDWDLGLRRYIIRLNSGDSGPSCVGVASPGGVAYDELDAVPEGTTYEFDDYYDESCTLRGDNSGLPDSPDVALGYGDWWGYGACLTTNLKPHLLQLADGHVIKLVVEAYYESGQDSCNSGGSDYGESGFITIRWGMVE